jgi:hypothetical protein
MLSAFNCIQLDGKYYLRADVHMVCYEGPHKMIILFFVLPSLFLWVIGIPIFALVCLVKNRILIYKCDEDPKNLSRPEIEEIIQLKYKYGFLFIGYNKTQYFWEILIQFRKILLITSTVLLSVVSPES